MIRVPLRYGLWTVIAGTGTLTDSTLYNTNITGIPNGGTTTLQWAITNGTCADSVQITVTNNNFTVSAGPDQNLCSDTAQLKSDDPLSGTGVWTLLSGGGTFDNSTNNITVIRGLSQGSNVLQWAITRGSCSNSGTVTINNNTRQRHK